MLRLFRFLKPFRFLVAGALALVFLQSMAELYLPNLMSRIVDTGIVRGDTAYILRVGGIMLLVAAGGMLCAIAAGFLSSRAASGFGRDLRAKVFSQVESFSLHEFDKFGTASLITRTTNDITQMQMVALIGLRMVAMAPLMCIGGIIMAVREDAKLAWILAVVLPVLAGAVLLIARQSVPLFKALQVKLDKLNLVVREGLTGVRVIRAFDRQSYEQRRFAAANLDLTETAIRVNRIMASMMPVMVVLINFTTIAILWFGARRIDRGDLQVGSLMAFIQYAMQIMFSLMMASLMFVMIPRASASAARINQVLETLPEIADPQEARRAAGPRGLVEFRDVTFRYPGAEQPALSHITFTARPGELL